MIDDSMMLRSNDKALRGKPTSVHYWFHFARVILCLDVSRGQSVLTRWTSVLHESTKTSDVTQTMASPPPPPVPQPLSKCHLANKMPVHTEPEQNTASSVHTATVKHSQQTLPPPEKHACLVSFSLFFFNYRGQRTSHPRSKGVSQQTWQRSQSWNPSCVCVREREGVYDLCMEAMKKPIVVAPVCLISVYTTMSVVLWSPLVRLLCGALLWAEWEHRGKCRSLCVPYSSMCVIRDTHQRSRLSGCGLVFASPGELSVLDAAWFTAARPRGSRIGWRCCPVCQPGPRGVKFSLPVYFMHFNN